MTFAPNPTGPAQLLSVRVVAEATLKSQACVSRSMVSTPVSPIEPKPLASTTFSVSPEPVSTIGTVTVVLPSPLKSAVSL